ncbi:MAG: hypothetical protein M3N54_03120 [Acidobacteriota bacterium]|nr:hypothetical protein [Acidobacteriota bacterium]
MFVEAEIPEDAALYEQLLETIPDKPAVFLLWAREGKPYLARTNVLRRRLRRLLHLRGTATRLEYQFTGSRLESQFLMWERARGSLGEDYARQIRLRFPVYVKLGLTNPYPRTRVTTQIGRAAGVCVGPFRNRSTAALFESEFLDLFQLRRCQEDLVPHLDHPGCMYGEMGRCLRPCQQAVGIAEYQSEVERVAAFLQTGGKSLTETTVAARERLSGEMDFEGAAMMHQRLLRVTEVMGLCDEMARDVDHLHAITITPSAQPEAVEVGFVRHGYWQGMTRLEFGLSDATAVSLDARLRAAALAAPECRAEPRERLEQLAILSRWFYSSWRDGEMLLIDDWSKIPCRKLVNAVSRVANPQRTPRPSSRS